MAVDGYYRHPTVHDDRVVFVCEDDLWVVGLEGGVASRLTANPGAQSRPRLSPDGSEIAFLSRDEGRLEVFVMPARGGESRRVSHLGAGTTVAGWSPDGSKIVAATDHAQPFVGWTHLVELPAAGGPPRPVGIGPAFSIGYAPDGRGRAIGRNGFDPARWKRYRGGRAGTIWVDRRGNGDFQPLIDLQGNLADPMWVGRRIYFLSDHEGVGNLYSVTPTGKNLVRLTDHQDFYMRLPQTDGRTVVYQCGADLWAYDIESGEYRKIEVTVQSARPQRNRTFQGPGRFLESVDLHPEGHSLAVIARGGAYTMPLWEGAVHRHGEVSRHRNRLSTWLPDGKRFVSVSDEGGEESLVVRTADGSDDPLRIEADLGRIRSIHVAPKGALRVAVTNHRHELWIVNLSRKSTKLVHHSPRSWIAGAAWSPDGRWLAYGAAETEGSSTLFVHDTRTGRSRSLGRPEFYDWSPSFDPSGQYLVFLSGRVFDPVADSLFHDHSFPQSQIPMVVPLRKGKPSPTSVTLRQPRAPGSPQPNGGDNGDDSVEVEIDFEGVAERVQALPVAPARYTWVAAVEGRVLVLSHPVAGARPPSWVKRPPDQGGTLSVWDLSADKLETVAEGVRGVTLSLDRKVMSLRIGKRLRVVPTSWKDDKSGKDGVGRDTGWIDLDRIRMEVRPGDEWRQMFSEAWRLQRDHYWVESMGGVDWVGVHDRYAHLVDRVAARSEFSDLMWEMQGELGTSHAYEMGGAYRPEPTTTMGSLGVDLEWSRGAWRISSIPHGDNWDPAASSPMVVPGVDAYVGDRILAIDGHGIDRSEDPNRHLVDRAGRSVSVTLGQGRKRPRTVPVVPLSSETALRYRDWVNGNRDRVRQWSGGRAGYIHIPDMLSWGYSEFHRAWLTERDFDGLLIDVRFNRGGNVSQLLMQRLLRKRLGYRIARWRDPAGFPYESPAGPMVCLTNQNAGSDGDIFSHTFKLHGLGPLIGTRTWGGVIGIWPQQSLVDGTVTTQPEFSTWFADVGYSVENYGTDPDIEVIDRPQDYVAGEDPQLRRGVEELVHIIDSGRFAAPDFGPEPSVAPPRLPRATD